MQQPTSKDTNYLKLLKKAFRFILQRYQEFPHDAKVPSCFYPIEVAIIAAEKFRLGAKLIVCALLHSVLKDKKASELTLRQEFGEEITSIVKGLTKVSGISYSSSTNEFSNLKYVITRFTPNNLLIVLIKLAEYLHKMYGIEKLSWEKQAKLADEACRIYIPLAHNLGLNNVYLELEDLHLKFRHRIVYDSIVKKIRATKTSKVGFLERFAKQVYTAVQRAGIRCVIKGRTKSIASISSKIKDRGIKFEDIHDFYAIRVIFESELGDEFSNCWSIYEAITGLYSVKINNLRDWISRPKGEGDGYEALHLTVQSHEEQWVEIQIRAKRMDNKAEYGDAAHWKYKSNNLGKEFNKMDTRWLERARDYLIQNEQKHQQNDISISVNRIYVEGELTETCLR
jgi:GTP pyrophosphokinase